MNKFLGRIVSLAVVAVLAAPATADMTLRITVGPGSGPGGEFQVEPLSDWDFVPVSLGELTNPFRFETFCLERYEYFQPGQIYHAVLNTGAVCGDGGGSGSFDPLGEQAAYLYSRFVTGRLDGYDYGPTRASSADALQDVIWYLEGEIARTWTDADGSLQDKFYQDAMNNAQPGHFYNVRVLNVWEHHVGEEYSGLAQDQLVMVPAPGAAALGVIGLTVVGALRRRLG